MKAIRRWRGWVLAAALPITVLATAPAFGRLADQLPNSVEFHGQPLSLASCAVRSVLFQDLYGVGIYMPQGLVTAGLLRDQAVPKLIAMKVLYGGRMPSGLPADWQRELRQNVAVEYLSGMDEAYSRIGPGDVMSFGYLPGQGTTIALNGLAVELVPDHGIIDAMLNVWVGPNNVAGNQVKRDLLSGRC